MNYLKPFYPDMPEFIGDIWEENLVSLWFSPNAKNEDVEKVLTNILSLFNTDNIFAFRRYKIFIIDTKNIQGYFTIVISVEENDFRKYDFLKYINTIDISEALRFYEEKKKGKTDSSFFISQQIALLILESYLKFNVTELYFEFQKENNKLTFGMREKKVDFGKIKSQIGFNPQGMFWKREWMQDKNKTPLTGGGKMK